jgi:hypothetical protein
MFPPPQAVVTSNEILFKLLKPRYQYRVFSFVHYVFYYCEYDWVLYATEILAFLEHIGTKICLLTVFTDVKSKVSFFS